MRKIKIGIIGSNGRMGKELIQAIELNPRMALHCLISRAQSVDEESAREVDVWIDFSSPKALLGVLKRAAKNKSAVVCGTTGFSIKEKTLLKKYSTQIPILWSSNMSVGVAVLNEAIKALSVVSNFDFQIEELHHNRKKDKPSGTALTLQENLEKIVGKKVPEPLAIRGGGIFGIHKVYSMSDEEVLTFEHNALNRSVFAKGALTCSEWIVKKKPGLYGIRDVLFGK